MPKVNRNRQLAIWNRAKVYNVSLLCFFHNNGKSLVRVTGSMLQVNIKPILKNETAWRHW
jgi:hypothetical protein